MKVIVDCMPNNPVECLFCGGLCMEICKFNEAFCVFSPYIEKEENRICPYLIELNETK